MKQLKFLIGVVAAVIVISLLCLILLLNLAAAQDMTDLLLIVSLPVVVLIFVGSIAFLTAVFIRWKVKLNEIPRHETPSQQLASQHFHVVQEILFQSFRTDLEARSTGVKLEQSTEADRKSISTNKVLFVTSNGGGLGHVSRTLAIAAEFNGEVRFFTLSRGYSLIANAGYHGIHVPSHEYIGVSRKLWGRIFTTALLEELAAYSPNLIVFDGAAIYPELRSISKISGVPLVWVRRGLWKKRIRQQSRQYNFPETVCDYLIEPGDLALGTMASKDNQTPSEPWKFSVPAIVIQKPELLISRDAALSDLQLNANNRYVLIQLGAGKINNIQDAEKVAADAVHGLGPEWIPIIARSPISETETESNWPVLSHFPLASYFNAFEFCVISGGYNSVQETLSLGLPCVSVPNRHTYTDDQAARTYAAAQRGLMVEANNTVEIASAVLALGDEQHRQRIRRNLALVPYPRGAHDTARILERIIDQNKQTQRLSF